MKIKSIHLASLVLASASCLSAVTLVPGVPGDSLLATPTGPSLKFGTIYNFDSLTANSTYSSNTIPGVSINSPDGLVVLPYSTQSNANELFDNSSNGTANITVKVAAGTNEIGVGIADSDGVSVTLNALGLTGNILGTFNVTTPSTTANAFNGYWAISDTSYDIFGLQIVQSSGNVNYSGLAIDDLQVAPTPEPATLGLLGIGTIALLASRLRKRA